MKINIKPLVWIAHDSQFSRDWKAELPNLGTNYYIWIERDTGKTKVSGLNRQHHYFNNIEEAKEWCQKDFERSINEFISHEPTLNP